MHIVIKDAVELTAVSVVTPKIRRVHIMQRATPAIVVMMPNLIGPGANISKLTFCMIWE